MYLFGWYSERMPFWCCNVEKYIFGCNGKVLYPFRASLILFVCEQYYVNHQFIYCVIIHVLCEWETKINTRYSDAWVPCQIKKKIIIKKKKCAYDNDKCNMLILHLEGGNHFYLGLCSGVARVFNLGAGVWVGGGTGTWPGGGGAYYKTPL